MKVRAIMSIVLVVMLLTSCASGGTDMFENKKGTDTELADEQMDMILKAIYNQDTELFLTLFSPNALNAAQCIENDIDALFSCCTGQYKQYNNWGGPYVEDTRESGNRTTVIFGTYDVEIGGTTYRFAFKYIVRDTANSQNVGIWSLYVMSTEDDSELQFAYWGDGLYSPGLHIEIDSQIDVSLPRN